jgi:hypothetical protein
LRREIEGKRRLMDLWRSYGDGYEMGRWKLISLLAGAFSVGFWGFQKVSSSRPRKSSKRLHFFADGPLHAEPPERTLHLHLYLHARSILSSSTRLNQIGPYNAQTLLLHAVPPIIDAELAHYLKQPWEGDVTISSRQPREDEEEEDVAGPAGVWPLGDVLQGRHDWMHSKMFNT